MIKNKKILIVVSKQNENKSIVNFLKSKFKQIPKSLIYKLLREKKILLNEKKVSDFSIKLQDDDKIKIKDKHLQIYKPKKPLFTEIDFTILYEDENILLVVKKHGQEIYLKNDKNCLDNKVKYYFYQKNKFKYEKNKNDFFFPLSIHRLDKLTQGIVIYVKKNNLLEEFYVSIKNKNKIKKKYLAVCVNKKKKLPFLIEGWIAKNESLRKMKFYLKKPLLIKDVKFCSMITKRIFINSYYSIYEITLNTGRKHQIRSCFSTFNSPIIGDIKYGSKVKLNNKIYLFAYKLSFFNFKFGLSYLNGMTFKIPNLHNELLEKCRMIKFDREKKPSINQDKLK